MPAPSPPGLKSSIEYLAMSVGIGRTLYGPPEFSSYDNLLSQRTMMEAALRKLPLPLTILRPAWFIDNAASDMASACETGVIHTFLQPPGKAFPMVAAKDVGRVAADLIQESETGIRIVELEGPCRVIAE